MFRFGAPWVLTLLPLVLATGWWMSRRRTRADARLVLPNAVAAFKLPRSPWIGMEKMLPVARTLVLVLLVLALARPQSGARQENLTTEGVDIVVALDNSRSMLAEDFRPKNRLEVAKRTVAEFVGGRPHDRIGLVVFAGLAATRCPLTLDHEMFMQFLDPVEITFPDDQGTAIGMGLATAVNRLRASTAESRVVVLVTDGRNNAGQLGPEAAAEAARALGIKVYTIGVGTEGEAPIPVDTARGRRYVRIRVDLDEDLLEKIAEATDGQYFRATDPDGLRQIFATIDTLEKTEIESRVRMLYSERFPLLLAPAVILLLLERLASVTRLRRIP